jgi:hypothetical protein
VINKTGITGNFDFHLEYTSDETLRTLPPDDSGPPGDLGTSRGIDRALLRARSAKSISVADRKRGRFYAAIDRWRLVRPRFAFAIVAFSQWIT